MIIYFAKGLSVDINSHQVQDWKDVGKLTSGESAGFVPLGRRPKKSEGDRRLSGRVFCQAQTAGQGCCTQDHGIFQSALLPCLGEGSPTKIDYRKKVGTLIHNLSSGGPRGSARRFAKDCCDRWLSQGSSFGTS